MCSKSGFSGLLLITSNQAMQCSLCGSQLLWRTLFVESMSDGAKETWWIEPTTSCFVSNYIPVRLCFHSHNKAEVWIHARIASCHSLWFVPSSSLFKCSDLLSASSLSSTVDISMHFRNKGPNIHAGFAQSDTFTITVSGGEYFTQSNGLAIIKQDSNLNS